MEKRNSNYELVRFIAAVSILLGHAASKGNGILLSTGVNNAFFHVLGCGANLGSGILAAISFWFMLERRFSTKQVLKIWFKTWFYYTLICLVELLLGNIVIGKDVFTYAFPICGRPYWFVTAYIIFYFIRPMLETFFLKLKNPKYVCYGMIFLFCLVPFVFNNSVLQDELTLFAGIYAIVFLVATQYRETKIKGVGILGAIILLLMSIGNWALQRGYIYKGIDYNLSNITIFSTSYSPFILLIIVLMMFYLKDLPEKKNVICNKFLGGGSLGIYLFHCHPLIKDNIFWNHFSFGENINSVKIWGILIVIILFTVISVFIIDYLEEKTFNKLLSVSWVQRIIQKIDSVYNETN